MGTPRRVRVRAPRVLPGDKGVPWTIRIALIVAGILLAIAAVGLWNTRPSSPGPRPTLLRLGILPGLDDDDLRSAYTPLADHVSRRTAIPCKLVIPEDHDDLVAQFGRGDVDLAWFGALTFLEAHAKFGAVPIAKRDEDARLTTVFVVRSEDADRSLDDFKGKRVAFGSERSTSGHLMARHHLIQSGWDPAKDLVNAHFHEQHDVTAYHVRDGQADLGALNGLHLRALYESGDLSPSDVVILERSAPYVDYVWAVQPRMRADIRRRISEALLMLDPLEEEDAEILSLQMCGGYVPARLAEFDRVRNIAKGLDLLGAD